MKKTLAFGLVIGLLALSTATAAPYDDMDYGPFLCATFESPWPAGNVAYRGVAVPFELPAAEGVFAEGPIGGGNFSKAKKQTAIAGASEPELYRSNRSSFGGYKLNVPVGTYRVTLHFAETAMSAKGARVFDVLVQGKVLAQKLDILDRVGPNAALDLVAESVEVKAGQQLLITFNKVQGQPCISGVTVEAPGYSRKIRSGGNKLKDYAADWPAGMDADKGARKGGVIFDTEMLRYMTVWTGGFLRLDGVAFSGAHGPNPGPLGQTLFATRPTPGVTHTSLKDPREPAYGPLPRDWARYKGLYRYDGGVLFRYSIGSLDVLDTPGFEAQDGQRFFVRTLQISNAEHPATIVLADLDTPKDLASDKKQRLQATTKTGDVVVTISGAIKGTELEVIDGSRVVLKVPPSKEINRIKIAHWTGGKDDAARATTAALKLKAPADLAALTHGGKALFTETVTTKGKVGNNKGAYALDTITPPFNNPYKSWIRFGGFDFFSDGRLAITTWSGDVWIASGIDETLEKITWKRFAAGLFQPLGLKIVDDQIYVLCRDGIMHLHDLNKDGEADYYECFNNDFLVTKNFHEFIFDLHTDHEGNFYFIKGGPVRPGGSGWDTITPSHGSLFKVSRDGSKLETVARGFRAPNGMGIGPNDEITTGDNEGTWTPMCPINWIKPGGFYGVPDFSMISPLPTIRDNPLCWMPKEIDNSSGGQVWITGKKFGPLSGHLLHLSYGHCKLFNVLKEEVGGQMQGGVVPIPITFDTGIMRARFVEKQNALYLAGLKGWQTDASKDAGLYRVRYTGQPADLPVGLHVEPGTIKVTFSDAVDKKSAEDVDSYNLQRWNYRWTQAYGSPHFKVSNPKQQGHDDVEVESATLSPDGKTITLKVADLKPVMQMKIAYRLKMADGTTVRSEIHNTVNVVGNLRGEVHVGEYRIVQKK